MFATWWPAAALAALVALLTWAQQQPRGRGWFRWLPVPLWCYLLPVIAVTIGALPAAHPVYPVLTINLLPVALALLLLSVDLGAVLRTSGKALLMAVTGAVGIMGGAVLAMLLLRHWLPIDAWKGAGTLAATWTGGTMNLLSLRTVLETPEPIFAALVIVDALIAYSWMALLVAASAWQPKLNRWLRTADYAKTFHHAAQAAAPVTPRMRLVWLLLAGGLAAAARYGGTLLPASTLVSSANGWTVLLVTSGGLLLSLLAPIRRLAAGSATWGVFLLLVVLAATGAQARLDAFAAAPIWLGFGACAVLTHGIVLLIAGRYWRVPLGVLATASQANIGGLVSAPLVGAVYHPQLAPVGLVLAMAGNAVGTYIGLLVAAWCR